MFYRLHLHFLTVTALRYCMIFLIHKVFPYPLSITLLHVSLKFLLAWFLRILYNKFFRVRWVELKWSDNLRNVSLTGITRFKNI